jgi:hypothetical protein
MANVEINDLTLKAVVDATDELEVQETGGGSTRKTTVAGLRITQSQVTDLVASYGFLYEDNDSGSTITVTTAGTYYGWTTATEGEVAGAGYVTSDVADGTADHLTIGANGAGIYHVSFSVSFGGTGGAVVEVAIFVNGAETSVEFLRTLGVAGDTGSAGAVGILDLSASDEVSVRFTSDDNGDDVDVYRCQLLIHRIA